MTQELFASGEIVELSEQYVQPFYQQRSQQVKALFEKAMKDIPVEFISRKEPFFCGYGLRDYLFLVVSIKGLKECFGGVWPPFLCRYR